MDAAVEVDDESLLEMIDEEIGEKAREGYIRLRERHTLRSEVFNSFRKLDVLQELLEEPEITEIMINGENHIFIEREGRIAEWEGSFESRDKLEDVVQQMVTRVNRLVNESHPIVDVRLEDGSRVNVVLPPVSLEGPVVTIRKFPQEVFTLERLVEVDSITREAADFMRRLVRARYNIFISGGTGSGKTSFLNALSNDIPKDERVITIEDSAELQIRGIPNLVRLEVRNANVEGKNEVTIRELIKTSLRMRPDRIVVGEVRDAAAVDMLSAMNTGHDGSLSTGHANSPKDMLSRLETLVLMGIDIPLAAIRAQIASAIDVVVHLGRLRDKSRKVLEISEVSGMEGGQIVLNPLFVHQGESGRTERLLRTERAMVNKGKLERAGIDEA